MSIIELIINAYKGYANYLWNTITNFNWYEGFYNNYFYWLLIVSGFFFLLEVIKPWREKQSRFRKDFWLDFFYMFFNFFLFSLVIYNAASEVVVHFFNDGILAITGWDLKNINPLYQSPLWLVLLTGFIVRDFVQWWTHRLLHRVEFLWEFHKVHHSVEQMGFAAHLRYHWMENVVYRTVEYLPLALLGIGLYDFFIIHLFTLAVGHYNHSNISVKGPISGGVFGGLIGIVIAFGYFEINLLHEPVWYTQMLTVFASILIGVVVLGPFMKKIFNSPEMHIWHHAYNLPKEKKYGVNFGLTLAIWDFVFGTAHIPYDGKDIRLGFPGVENFPDNFGSQVLHGITPNKD